MLLFCFISCLLYVYRIFFLRVCLCVTYVPNAHVSQKEVLDPLELGLQGITNYMWVLDIEPRSSERSASALNP